MAKAVLSLEEEAAEEDAELDESDEQLHLQHPANQLLLTTVRGWGPLTTA